MEFAEKFDTIVAIANGGIIPAALVNQRLNVEFHLLKIHFRDDQQKPEFERPKLMSEPGFKAAGRHILLVEDRVKTGASLQLAKELLKDAATLKTFAVNGPADYSLFNENCFRYPWNF